jgi:hypothetical protein
LTSVNFVSRLFSLVIGGLLGSVYIALGLFAFSGIFVYGYLCFMIMNYAEVSWMSIKNILFSNFKIISPLIGIILILKYLNFSSLVIVMASFLVVFIYYGHIFRKNKQLREILNQLGLKRLDL